MRKKRDLKNRVDQPELPYLIAEPLFDLRFTVRQRYKTDVEPGFLKAVQGSQKSERALVIAELAVNSEIGAIRFKLAPPQMRELRIILRDFGLQRL